MDIIFALKRSRANVHERCHWSICLCMLLLCGCTHHTPVISPEARTEYATTLAKAAGWKTGSLHTTDFTFKVYESTVKHSSTLTIYIEGDGLAWLSTDTPSTNPTPMNPIGLKLALRDKTNTHVVYLARACQFVFGTDWRMCQSDDWTSARFSPAIVHATQQAINTLKIRHRAKKIILVGYSGGGAIATLVAANRTDVVRLITIAGTLDTTAWVRQNSLTPLYGSLNPADAWKSLVAIPQTHWVGGNDTVVPKAVAFAYANRFPIGKQPDIRIKPTYDHTCCWATTWKP